MSITRRSPGPKAPRKPNRHDQQRNFFLGASRTQHAHDPTAVQNVGAKAIRLRKLETVGKFHERKRLESISERHGEGLKTARTSSVVAHGDLSSEFVHRPNQLRVTSNKCRSLCLLNRHMADRRRVNNKFQCFNSCDPTTSDLDSMLSSSTARSSD